MSRKQKLELTWIGKEDTPKLEPRALVEEPEKSHHAPHRVGDHDLFDNKLIFGDNLLAPSLIKTDQWGNEVINPDFHPELLSEAVCKIEGFTYAPSAEVFWKHGHATESDFIYVTTQNLSRPQLETLSQAVGPDRSLLVC